MKIRIFGLVIILSLISPSWVQAQDLVTQAWKDFNFQLEQFRPSYEDFLVKRDTYERSLTFSAEEELVTSARDMLIARDTVWWTYFQGLKTQLVAHRGFAVEKRQPLEQQLIGEQEALMTHKNSLIPLLTKTELQAKATEINEKVQIYSQVTYKNLIALKIADFRLAVTTIGQLSSLIRDGASMQIRDSSALEVRLRGLDGLDALLREITTKIDALETSNDQLGDAYINETGFDQTIEKSAPAYAQLKQAQQLVRELSQGLEL